ncbi:hypothetical protein NDU88_006151 [Pleurodeles waltl]|uniref:Uncharacterized protein n=1 Tax=Pleurodeles waltl TaxID=8319 RepID=A0AAV7UL41_PLEWA|nr:hypothetical protein NDU88_006151 [Pleurodeles waltl]
MKTTGEWQSQFSDRNISKDGEAEAGEERLRPRHLWYWLVLAQKNTCEQNSTDGIDALGYQREWLYAKP